MPLKKIKITRWRGFELHRSAIECTFINIERCLPAIGKPLVAQAWWMSGPLQAAEKINHSRSFPIVSGCACVCSHGWILHGTEHFPSAIYTFQLDGSEMFKKFKIFIVECGTNIPWTYKILLRKLRCSLKKSPTCTSLRIPKLETETFSPLEYANMYSWTGPQNAASEYGTDDSLIPSCGWENLRVVLAGAFPSQITLQTVVSIYTFYMHTNARLEPHANMHSGACRDELNSINHFLGGAFPSNVLSL